MSTPESVRTDRLIHDDHRIHQWIRHRSGLVQVADFVGIGRELDGELVAAFGYDHHQDSSCMFHMAVAPHGLNRALLRKAFEVPFKQWNYRKLIGIIQKGNVKSLNLAQHLGFSCFASLPDAHPSGALEFYQMDASECKWLK